MPGAPIRGSQSVLVTDGDAVELLFLQGPARLNRIEVGRVGWQELQRCPAAFHQFPGQRRAGPNKPRRMVSTILTGGVRRGASLRRTQSMKRTLFMVCQDVVNVSHPFTVTAPTIVRLCQCPHGWRATATSPFFTQRCDRDRLNPEHSWPFGCNRRIRSADGCVLPAAGSTYVQYDVARLRSVPHPAALRLLGFPRSSMNYPGYVEVEQRSPRRHPPEGRVQPH